MIITLITIWTLTHAAFTINPDYTCFTPEPALKQQFTCRIAGPGIFPEKNINSRFGRCCTILTGNNTVEILIKTAEKTSGFQEIYLKKGVLNHKIPLKPAINLEIRALDKNTFDPVYNTLITIAKSPLHLMSEHQYTDYEAVAAFKAHPGHTLNIAAASHYYLPINTHTLNINTQNIDEHNTLYYDIYLDPGRDLTGIVTDPNGNPVEYAKIRILVQTAPHATWDSTLDMPKPVNSLAMLNTPRWIPARPELATDSEGIFHIPAIYNGKVTITATHPDWAPARPIKLPQTEGNIENITLRLQKNHTTAVAVFNEVQTPIDATLRYKIASELEWSDSYAISSKRRTVIKKLPPEIIVEISAPNYATLTRQINISDLENYDFTLSHITKPITGTITDSNGPVKNASVVAVSQNAYSTCATKSQNDGTYSLNDCNLSQALLEIRAPEHPPHWVAVNSEQHQYTTLPHPASLTLQINPENKISFDNQIVLTLTWKPETPANIPTFITSETFEISTRNFNIPRLPPAPATLTLAIPEFLPLTREIYPEPAQTLNLELYPIPEKQLELVIVDKWGAPVENSLIIIDNKQTKRITTHDPRITLKPETRTIRAAHYQHRKISATGRIAP